MSARWLSRFGRIYSELRLLGWRGTRFRIGFEIRRRFGLDVLLKRPTVLDVERYLGRSPLLPTDPEIYRKQWRKSRQSFGLACADVARPVLRSLIKNSEPMITRAVGVRKSEFVFFRHDVQRYSGKFSWFVNPESGVRWPAVHSSKLLLDIERYGDIKLVWEVGRGSWIIDLVRAWLVDGDEKHLTCMFDLIDDFGLNNPLYIGPHWSSEQEVSIRALMLIFAQEVLAEENELTGKRLQSLHALLEMHGRYLERDLDYAETAIRNNHLIHGALGLYAVGHALPFHPMAQTWCDRAKTLLTEAAHEQWYEDGGYVQPSHNYQRSAWHGMLWAYSIAMQRGDYALTEQIKDRANASLDFFLAQMDHLTGQLPNWGPNDGALIGVWTDCDYSDFRPLVQSLAHLAGRPLVFETGPWNEELMWFFGPEALDSKTDSIPLPDDDLGVYPRVDRFDVQGLHVLRASAHRFAVFRCGSVRSRYGQQADQLHVDLWSNGLNLALDSGSYNYNKDPRTHNWFRGTASHNTVMIGNQDQMVPIRTFKYLRWTRASSAVCNVEGMGQGLIGVHHGYTRYPQQWVHARMLIESNATWFVVDRLWPLQPNGEDVELSLHWLLAPGEAVKHRAGVALNVVDQTFFVSVAASRPVPVLHLISGSESPIDGWHSRYYNHRQAVPALVYKGRSSEELWFATAFGNQKRTLSFSEDLSNLDVGDRQSISLQPLREQAQKMIEELMDE